MTRDEKLIELIPVTYGNFYFKFPATPGSYPYSYLA